MICTIDIGLRNLAICCMSAQNLKDISSYNIALWDIYNTLDSDDYKCESIKKNGKVCGAKCSLKYLSDQTTIHCCKTHFPKNIEKTQQNAFKIKPIDSYLLQDIAKTVLAKVQHIYDSNLTIFESVNQVLIELQPGINKKMIFTSHLVYAKLVELYRHTSTTIRFVRASQKLKAYTGPEIQCKLKGSYARRKWLSIQYTRWFLETKFSQDQKDKWLSFFDTKTVKADLSDCYLMSINGLFGIPKKQLMHKNGAELK